MSSTPTSWLLSFLGFGDALITATIIAHRSRTDTKLAIVGTEITERVAELAGGLELVNHTLFSDVPSFYAIRKHSPIAVLQDISIVRRWAASAIEPDDIVLFERPPSIRNRCLIPRARQRIIEVPVQRSAYEDRAHAYAPVLGHHNFPNAPQPTIRAQSVLINPSARHKSRELPRETVRFFAKIFHDQGVMVTLIDLDGSYEDIKCDFDRVLTMPSLVESAAALKRSDRYLGPDSFFVHLAYFYRIPELVFFPDNWTYFSPPGLIDSGLGLRMSDLINHVLLEERILKLIG